MPKPDVVVPTQSSHAERSLDGIVPGWQGSHVDCASLATLPGSSHIVQLEPSELTNPVVQSEHSLCDTQRCWLHSVPEAHLNGAAQDVESSDTMLGARHSWQTPKVEYVVPAHASQSSRASFGPVLAAHAVHHVGRRRPPPPPPAPALSV